MPGRAQRVPEPGWRCSSVQQATFLPGERSRHFCAPIHTAADDNAAPNRRWPASGQRVPHRIHSSSLSYASLSRASWQRPSLAECWIYRNSAERSTFLLQCERLYNQLRTIRQPLPVYCIPPKKISHSRQRRFSHGKTAFQTHESSSMHNSPFCRR